LSIIFAQIRRFEIKFVFSRPVIYRKHWGYAEDIVHRHNWLMQFLGGCKKKDISYTCDVFFLSAAHVTELQELWQSRAQFIVNGNSAEFCSRSSIQYSMIQEARGNPKLWRTRADLSKCLFCIHAENL
jgi:hypothetical protein